jgi:NADH-quinone oxidoreductase subunit C
MEPVEHIRDRVLARFPGAGVDLVPNTAPGASPALLLPAEPARAVAEFLRDDPELRFDTCSNVTGLDWPDKPDRTGYLEVVYHLYSVSRRHGPLVLRLRTGNRSDRVSLPSLTPVWRACEFQEREVFDLFGVVFDGHPDLRRILMWDEFKGHPLRKDYVEPDDYEWEPTPHGAVLAKAKRHAEPPPAREGGASA